MQGFVDECVFFVCVCVLCRNSKAAKNGGKTIIFPASRLCRYPVFQKSYRNHSILYHFRDKYVSVFYAEIQDGRQKWQLIFVKSRQ